MENKELTTTQETTAIQGFITQAIEKGLPVETMEKLFALREKAKAEFAKEEFVKAMANFQKECPVIEKTKAVYEKGSTTKVRYKYAPLDSIVSQVKTPLANNNLSYDFLTEESDGFINIICTVTHALGHSKSSSFRIPIGTEAFMTDVQKYGARVTFGKRYSFCNALGILTGDEDIDAKEEDDNKLSDEIIKKVKDTTTEEQLKRVWEEHKGLGKEFATLVTEHKNFINKVKKR